MRSAIHHRFGEPAEVLDLYTRQSCLSVTARDLAVMGALLWAAWYGGAYGLARVRLPGALHTLLTAGLVTLLIGLGFAVYVAVLRVGGFPGADGLARLPGSLWRKIRGRKPAPPKDPA